MAVPITYGTNRRQVKTVIPIIDDCEVLDVIDSPRSASNLSYGAVQDALTETRAQLLSQLEIKLPDQRSTNNNPLSSPPPTASGSRKSFFSGVVFENTLITLQPKETKQNSATRWTKVHKDSGNKLIISSSRPLSNTSNACQSRPPTACAENDLLQRKSEVFNSGIEKLEVCTARADKFAEESKKQSPTGYSGRLIQTRKSLPTTKHDLLTIANEEKQNLDFSFNHSTTNSGTIKNTSLTQRKWAVPTSTTSEAITTNASNSDLASSFPTSKTLRRRTDPEGFNANVSSPINSISSPNSFLNNSSKVLSRPGTPIIEQAKVIPSRIRPVRKLSLPTTLE